MAQTRSRTRSRPAARYAPPAPGCLLGFLTLSVSQQVFDVGGVACATGSHLLSERSLQPQVDAAEQQHGVPLRRLTAKLLCAQEAEETGWGRSLQAGVDSPASTCTEEEEEEETR